MAHHRVFAPDRTFEDVLCDAGRRGVDLRVLVIDQEVDKELARQAAQRSCGKLLGAGLACSMVLSYSNIRTDVSREVDLETWEKRPQGRRTAELATEVVRQSL